MCLIAWSWQPASDTPLLLLGNRDEFYARPTLPLHWWDGRDVLAGQDLQAGGTWLGIDRRGRLAALTNVRGPGSARTDAPSRGALVADFLAGTRSAADYAADVAATAQHYNPFNLLLYDGLALLALESRQPQAQALAPGVGAVSNAGFNTPWPKLRRLSAGLQTLVAQTQAVPDDQLLPLLQDRRCAADAELPSTGIPHALEHTLSAAFIATPDYGTRACSIVRLGRGQAAFTEHSYAAHGPTGTVRHRFDCTSPSSGPPPRKR